MVDSGAAWLSLLTGCPGAAHAQNKKFHWHRPAFPPPVDCAILSGEYIRGGFGRKRIQSHGERTIGLVDDVEV